MGNLIILVIILVVISIAVWYAIKNWTTITSKSSGVSLTPTKKVTQGLIFIAIIAGIVLAGYFGLKNSSSDEAIQPAAQVATTVGTADTTALSTTKPTADSAIVAPAVITTASEESAFISFLKEIKPFLYFAMILTFVYFVVKKIVELKRPATGVVAPPPPAGTTTTKGTSGGTSPAAAPSTPKKWYTPLLNMWFMVSGLIMLLGIIWYFNGRSKPDNLLQGKGVGGIVNVAWDLLFGESPEEKTQKDLLKLEKLRLQKLKEENRHAEIMKSKENNGKIIDALTGDGEPNSDNSQWYERRTGSGNSVPDNTSSADQPQVNPIFQTGLPPPTIPQPGIILVQ